MRRALEGRGLKAVAAAALVGVACAATLNWSRGDAHEAAPPEHGDDPIAVEHTLTTFESDSASTAAVEPGVYEMAAGHRNATTAIRHVASPTAGNPLRRDGVWCATVDGDLDPLAQPGLAWVGDDRILTLTNNVWDEQRARWAIHGWHRQTDGTWEVTPLWEQVELPGFIGAYYKHVGSELAVDHDGPSGLMTPAEMYHPPPWALCLRVDPDGVVAFQAWPAGLRSQPAWMPDPTHDPWHLPDVDNDNKWSLGVGFRLPEEWRFDGIGGFYGGHLTADQTIRFSPFAATAPIERLQVVDEPRWAIGSDGVEVRAHVQELSDGSGVSRHMLIDLAGRPHWADGPAVMYVDPLGKILQASDGYEPEWWKEGVRVDPP